MDTKHRIVQTRRVYNRWVNDQTLEDYALRFTSKSSRRWSNFRVANTATGAMSFLALEAIGGAITLNYGFANASLAIIVVGALMMVMGLPIAISAAREGLDIDLLTRGAGFGYLGSTITSLVYASFTFILFAIEAAIMSLALEMCFGVPLPVGYLISAALVIPIVVFGISAINQFQLWTLPIWVVLNIAPLAVIIWKGDASLAAWTAYGGDEGAAFNMLYFGAASGVIFGLMAQIGEQVDYLRFLPPPKAGEQKRWWTAVLIGGPGWVIPGIIKMFIGSFLAVMVLSYGVPVERAAEPNQMYYVAFSQVVASPPLALALMGAFVVVSQLKINVTNAYAGSIAWSNFFSRLTHRHPGRVVWLFFNVGIALILMEIGIFTLMEYTLGLFANLSVAWLGSVFADLAINRPLGLRPKHIEFRRAYLYDVNPVGVGSMAIAAAVSIIAYVGVFGETAQSLSPFLALLCTLIATPTIAWLTRGKYYIARSNDTPFTVRQPTRCCICELTFEPEDMAHCPVYSGPICSLCCSLDARCHDACKTRSRVSHLLEDFAARLLKPGTIDWLRTRISRYLALMVCVALGEYLILHLIYAQVTSPGEVGASAVAQSLYAVFFSVLIIAAVFGWWYILSEDSRRAAEEESRRHTNLLMREIRAHQRTDSELQEAKAKAEIANDAKNRYMAGLSHEFRTPLNTILGYAQILDDDPHFPSERRKALRAVKRSGEHLSGLVNGLLDFSRIEAGRLELAVTEFSFAEFLDEIADMFKLPAEAKGLDFTVAINGAPPGAVKADRQRLKQVLINLLSNAIRYTEKGAVRLEVDCGSQVTEFRIIDTGIGISDDDIERIFRPFEQASSGNAGAKPGAGLGLTITKFLTELMGGELNVKSKPGLGSTFSVKFLLSPTTFTPQETAQKMIRGYIGRMLTVLIVEDDPDHRELMRDVFNSIGFHVLLAENGSVALELCKITRPALFILDLSLPDIQGHDLAAMLRESSFEKTPIVIVSALSEVLDPVEVRSGHHDAAFTKPVQIPVLLEKVRELLNLQWTYETDAPPAPSIPPPLLAPKARQPVNLELVDSLREQADIGHIRGVLRLLDELEHQHPDRAPNVASLRQEIERLDFEQFKRLLETINQSP